MRLTVLIFSLLICCLRAQDADVPALPATGELESLARTQEAAGNIAEAEKTRALLEVVVQAKAAEVASENFRKRLAEVPAELEAIRGLMASTDAVPAISDLVPDIGTKTLRELEALASDAESKSIADQADYRELVAEIVRRKRRLDQIPELLAKNAEKLVDANGKLESGSLSDGERALLTARKRQLEATGSSFREEKRFYREAEELLTMRRDLAQRRSEVSTKRAARFQRLVDVQRVKLAAREAAKAKGVADSKKLAPQLVDIAKTNAALAEARRNLAGRIRTANDGLLAVRLRLQGIERDHADAVQQVNLVESAGVRLGQRTGKLLREEKNNLPRIDDILQDVRNGVELLTEARLKKVEYEKERRDKASDIDGEVADIVAVLGKDSEALARELHTARRNFLDDLIDDYGSYAEALSDTLSKRRDMIRRVKENADFIERRLLWISSAPPLHASDFSDARDGLEEMFSPRMWTQLLQSLSNDFRRHLLSWLLFAIILAYAMRHRGRHKRLLAEVGEIAAKRNCRVYLPTWQALFHTVIIAVPIPLVIVFIWWRTAEIATIAPLAHANDPSVEVAEWAMWTTVISGALREICFPAIALAISRGVSRPRGLLRSHLGMSSKRTALLFKGFTWAMILIIPLVFLRAGFAGFDFRPVSRIFFIVSMLVIAGFAVFVLRPSVGLFTSSKKSLWSSCAYPVYLGILGLAIGLAVAAYLGYYYTVDELSWRIRLSIWIILAVVFVASFVMRLLIVSRRRVAFSQRLATFRAAQAERAKAETGEEAPAAPNIAELEADLVDITKVKAQTQSLIRMSAIIAIVFFLWGVWVEVTPSLKVFDAVPVWSKGSEAAAASSGGDLTGGFLDATTGGGQQSGEEVGLEKIVPKADENSFVSLADLGLAIITLFLTYFAARNIPGLLEITLLQRLRLKPGGSYTVTTVVRYVIMLVGIITAFAYVDITWGKVQWIAAAITLGVGFGLQEVFANFVAGLILLFERPIRLGDFVTVGGVNGTVTQIRMRATTIKDRGNRELLVPNKEFITGQLINWTLTDVVIRIEVPVGIAYGSDTELARKLLFEVAAKHKFVLKDPEPSVVFTAFGASSLDFELRVFIRGADDMVRVGSDLHFEVDNIFRENGIEIAFPQRDLHIKSMPDGLQKGLTAGGEDEK